MDDRWLVHTLTVERAAVSSAYGEEFDAPEPVVGFYSDGTKLLMGPDGEQVVASGMFVFPPGVAYVPVRSRVTLPAKFGGQVRRVVTSAVGDGGGLPTPDHQEVGLL